MADSNEVPENQLEIDLANILHEAHLDHSPSSKMPFNSRVLARYLIRQLDNLREMLQEHNDYRGFEKPMGSESEGVRGD